MERNRRSKEKLETGLKRSDSKKHIDSVDIYVSFKRISSLTLPCIGVFMGSVKVLVYSYNQADKKPYTIQNYLPAFNVVLGSYLTEKECKQICLRVIKMFCDKLKE
jgi:hypothetical protein